MNQQLQGIFLAVILLFGAAAIPISSTLSVGFNSAYAVEVGTEVETEVGVKVGSNDESTEAKTETKAKGEVKSDSEMESDSEIEIKVHLSGNKATIEIKMNGEEKVHVLNTSSEAEIIAKIQSETSLTETEIKSIWEYGQESETKMQSSEKARMELKARIAAQTAGIVDVSVKAKEKAKIMISSMENKTSNTNERFHDILLKAKANGYLNTNTSSDASVKSYSLNLDGTAQSQSKASSYMEGALYLETMTERSNISKYRVSGGQVIIDGESYDVLFGKARATSTNNTSAESTMILLAEVMKPNGEVTTMKLLLKNDSSINSEAETSSWAVMNPESKLAGSWKMDAQATMSLTSA